MGATPLTEEQTRKVKKLIDEGWTHRDIAEQTGFSIGAVSRAKHRELPPLRGPAAVADKKVGTFDWREACDVAIKMQAIKKRMSWSQDEAKIPLGDGKRPVILMGFGDTHIGAYGANYALFKSITEEIIKTPNLYVALMGDLAEMAIRLRGVLEVTSQVLTPEMQDAFLESWLEDIADKVAFATWDNHAVMRQENAAGVSSMKQMLSRRFVYHNGIGHSDLIVGKQVYKVAASHKFRGSSMFNRMHAQGRYVRQEAADRELVLMGDIHTYGFSYTEDGGQERCYVTGGTLHENSGYAKRFFSLKTSPHYPCVVLHADSHQMVPFKTIGQALRYVGK
jgi:hypothetical protein